MNKKVNTPEAGKAPGYNVGIGHSFRTNSAFEYINAVIDSSVNATKQHFIKDTRQEEPRLEEYTGFFFRSRDSELMEDSLMGCEYQYGFFDCRFCQLESRCPKQGNSILTDKPWTTIAFEDYLDEEVIEAIKGEGF